MKLTFNDSSNLYFTSDQHWCHAHVIKYCNRPYQDVEEMNQVLIDNCNSVVKADDTILMLGDFCFGPLNKWVEIRNKIKELVARFPLKKNAAGGMSENFQKRKLFAK